MPQWNIEYLAHDVAGLANQPRRGRNPTEGYQRAFGLQSGNLPTLCQQDQDYQIAFRMAQQRTVVHPPNLMNLFLLCKFHLPRLQRGHIVEFGSYQGGSAIFLAYLAQQFSPGTHVYALDTFAGMPPTDRAIDLHKAGDFADADLAALQQFARTMGLANLTFIQGRFEETARNALQKIGPVALAHIDCDIYSAIACAYDSVKPHMVPGGYLVFDDPLFASCLGAMEAVEELLIRRDGLHAEQMYPHMVFRYPPIV